MSLSKFRNDFCYQTDVGKKKKDKKKLNSSDDFFQETVTFQRSENVKSKKIVQKVFITVIETVDTFGKTACSFTSATSSITVFGFRILPISTGMACTLSVGN